MKTMLALAMALFGTTAFGQSIGDLCSPQYADADEGFDKTFCNRNPLQMRRQLNKLFEANRMLFSPNAAALTPRDQSNRRWVEFPPAPEGWSLKLSTDDQSDYRDRQGILRSTSRAIIARYRIDDPALAGYDSLLEFVFQIHVQPLSDIENRILSGHRYDSLWDIRNIRRDSRVFHFKCDPSDGRYHIYTLDGNYRTQRCIQKLDDDTDVIGNTIRYYLHEGNPIERR